ncbi:LysR family transcriptional regulator [Halobacillus litoralis]|uniref:LysR family transcriptional regulator n=1 Tax=Halobacillus litoralis TaxID=45668 RepID=A0A845F839_9BACI|nr:LysR family transcriptional regulator [Halobacillus litoralis]MYL70110.1 LysR family transcriptional regulator [Halobacillus litoralis]
MDISYFYTFKEVAKWGSYTRTGEELGYAQSSVTTQIKKLEDYYGVRLVERAGQTMRLTQSGEQLLHYVDQVIDLLEEAESKVSKNVQMRGTVRIGAVESLAAYFISKSLKAFKEQNPDLRIQLESGLCPNLKEGVLESHYDLAVVLDEEVKHPLLETLLLRKEKMVIVAANEHPLVGQEQINIRRIEDETLILTEKDCSYRNMLEGILKKRAVEPRSVISFTSLEAIKQCVIDELGIAMLPEMTVAGELENGSLRALDFDHQGLALYIQIIHHQKKWLSPSLEKFIQLLYERR